MFLGSTPPAPRMPVTSREGFGFLGIPGGFSEGNPHFLGFSGVVSVGRCGPLAEAEKKNTTAVAAPKQGQTPSG